jgi:molybdate transport system substrate-binding protein
MRGGVAAVYLLTGVIAMSAPGRADTIQLYAAGSLRAALTEVAKSFEAETGNSVHAKYGPSGLLRDEIAGGARADVFASANMQHPQALSAAKKSGPVQLFARNRLCALVKAGLKIDSASLLERVLDPAIRLATSTPKADPSGDYALEVFAKAESIRPGARAALEKKAAQLTGSADSAQPPAAATSTVGTSAKDAPTFSSLIAPPPTRRKNRIPSSRSCSCPKASQSVPITVSP